MIMTEGTEKQLSLQERRQLNIQRNQSFLSSLLAVETNPVHGQQTEEDGSTITSLRGSNTIPGDDDLEENIARFQCKDEVIAAFPHRSPQVQLLYRYLARFDRIHVSQVLLFIQSYCVLIHVFVPLW